MGERKVNLHTQFCVQILVQIIAKQHSCFVSQGKLSKYQSANKGFSAFVCFPQSALLNNMYDFTSLCCFNHLSSI